MCYRKRVKRQKTSHVLQETSKTTENFRLLGLQAQKWTRELLNMQACCPRRAVGVTNNTRTLRELISLSTGLCALCLGRTSLGPPAILRTALFSDCYTSRNATYEARLGKCASAASRSSTKRFTLQLQFSNTASVILHILPQVSI